jgi:hypothetical protein
MGVREPFLRACVSLCDLTAQGKIGSRALRTQERDIRRPWSRGDCLIALAAVSLNGFVMNKHLDLGTQITLAITLALFVVALFEKGFTHDMLLEAGVFLVSAKLVLSAYKASVNNQIMGVQLAELSESLTRIEQRLDRNSAPERAVEN